MKCKNNITLFTFLFLCLNLYGQNKEDSTANEGQRWANGYIFPTTILLGGVLLNNSESEKKLKRNIRNELGADFSFPIDDYAQYVPLAILAGANIAGVEAKHHWFDQGKYLVISNLIVAAITHGLKRTVNKTRPNGESYAFPSGHTSFAFTNAMVLYKEYQYSAPFLAYSGFAFAGTTATFRMLNNKHWLSDVLAGAGIAMIVTELVYHFEPLKNFNPFLGQERVSILPQFSPNQQYGVLINIKL